MFTVIIGMCTGIFGCLMTIAEIIVVFLLPLSGVHIGLLVYLIVKVTRVETFVTTHNTRLTKLEETSK